MAAPAPVILAVEDEPRNAALLRAILRPSRYDLHVVSTLEAGRAWLLDRRPDVVLLDRHLPDGDGLSLVAELRARPDTADLRILLVTASVLATDREAAEQAGCDGFVSKPIHVAGLLDEIGRQLAHLGSGSPAGVRPA